MVRIDGKMAKKKMWVVHLDCVGQWGRLAFEAVERFAIPANVGMSYEDVVEVDEEFEPTPAPTPTPEPQPKPEPEPVKMTLKEAKQTIITVTNKKGMNVEKFVSELSDVQLEWVIASYQDPTGVRAAQMEKADRVAEKEKA